MVENIIAVVLMLLGLIGWLLYTHSPDPAIRRIVRLSTRTTLPIPDQLKATLLDRIRIRQHAVSAALAAAIVAFGIALWVSPDLESSVRLGGVALVAWTASVVVTGRDAWRRARTVDGPRVARPRASSVTDFVSTYDVGVAVVCCGGGMVLSGALAAIQPASASALLLTALIIAALAAMAAGVTHVLAGLPSPAGSDVELAWSDVLRSEVMRSHVYSASLLSLIVCSSALGGVTEQFSFGEGAAAVVDTVSFVIVVGGAVALLKARDQRFDRHVLHRLWPEEMASRPS